MTGQIGDKIYLKSQKNPSNDMHSTPLEEYFRQYPPRPNFQPQSTANWRGYVAKWEIENDKLYLIEIEGLLKERSPISIETFFPNQSGKVFANWFSGTLQAVDGNCLQYVHMGFESIYERDILITVNKGQVIKQDIIDNTKRQNYDPFSKPTPPTPPSFYNK